MLTNTNSQTVFKNVQIGIFFLRARASSGTSRDKFICSFHAQREVNTGFLAYCDCQAKSYSLFSTLC